MSVDSYLHQLPLKTLIISKWISIAQQSRYYCISTLKPEKSKCGKHDVFKLVKDMIKENITRDSLIGSGFVKCSLISNRTWLSCRKHNATENLNLQGNFNNFKEDLIEDFDKLKKKLFLLRLNHLKINY